MNKTEAVLGRFDYTQFWLMLFFSVAAVSSFGIGMLPCRLRHAAGFRIGAAWIGGMCGLFVAESIAYFLPIRNQMDNPWYLVAGGGVSESDVLPFTRPAHFKWEGLSRGDLALMDHHDDPYARVVSFATDWEGFRNGEDIRQADIITIGDSYTEAGNVPEGETFSKLIGERLHLKVRNLGRAGYSTPSELVVLKRYGLNCRPRIVVWQVCKSNDIQEAVRYQKWLAAGKPPYFDFDLDRKEQRINSWKQRSITFRIFELLRNHKPRSALFDGVFRDYEGVDYPIRFFDPRAPVMIDVDDPGWRAFSEPLATGADECRSNHIQMLVVLIPDKFGVLGPHVKTTQPVDPKHKSFSHALGAETLAGALRTLCDSLDVQFLDPTGPFEERTDAGELLYLPYDTHLSPLGHRVLADLIAERLDQLNNL